MLTKALNAARSLYYDLVLAPRGYGRPVTTATWDRQFRQGDWDHLYSIEELGHYMIVIGYVQQLAKAYAEPPAILDAGCGQGRLLDLLRSTNFSSYLGIDVSREAIRKAESMAVDHAQFCLADFASWQSDRRFDIIIFNESLSYAQRPEELCLRYADRLTPSGAIVVSLCRYGNHGRIWQELARQFSTLASTRVENSKQQNWDIRIMQPKPLL